MKKASLVTYPSVVEAPIIVVKIGDYTFGGCSKTAIRTSSGDMYTNITFPNFLQSVHITKINGQLNIYTISMEYGITKGDDPNLIDKVLSTVKDTRRLTITYGDASYPDLMYTEESAIITKVQTNVKFGGSQISYTIHATSDAIQLQANTYTFPKRNAKPSELIFDMLYNGKYGLLNVFPGMRDRAKVVQNGLIPSDDRVMSLEPKMSMTALDYLKFLVNSMTSSSNNTDNLIKDSVYMLSLKDDVSNSFGGQYFEIKKVSLIGSSSSYTTSGGSGDKFLVSDPYEVDIGYPGDDFVTDFRINTDEGYSILYDYGSTVAGFDKVYRINGNGDYVYDYSPAMARSSSTYSTNSAEKSWWTLMTQFPVTATLQIKGLVRPSILMSYVKINTVFYGQRHTSSGIYLITKQEDQIDGSGYKTTLTLLRVYGE